MYNYFSDNSKKALTAIIIHFLDSHFGLRLTDVKSKIYFELKSVVRESRCLGGGGTLYNLKVKLVTN